MKKILNPYPKYPGYNCYACSPNNEYGLRMEFFEDGDDIICEWKPINYMQGYHNMLHGGIQATLIDEIASWYVQIKFKTAGVTSSMNVKYIKPVSMLNDKITLKASLKKKRRNLIDMEVELRNANDELCAKGEVTYFTFSQEVARRDFSYPDYIEFSQKK
ncbi:MAG: PaaI family thioesterase [Lentimicrobiaceae bacterium]|jgi:uncharacterized protein (TIGR00369 family)|nr:PaaI family thioesterase [Lentimicrobiaceae bacterium]MCP4909545.1 PaaI family thioesterase [Bacteroidota bacterium]MBT3453455.1 PaaI family thioesterase [Lentimicrobiaceae bacterium]MBT3819006.1 PaaI family thioesterase [Lentimicrobiaceae bacterium]MBT4060465.1 PaaI family thioesterase [Lentimicrobiaceae bacterium]